MKYFWSSIRLAKSVLGLKPKPHFPENQSFSLPTPILRYFLSNAFISNQIKLFKSCKIFRNFFRQFPGLKINELTFTWFMSSKSGRYIITKNSLIMKDTFFKKNSKYFSKVQAQRIKFKNFVFDIENYEVTSNILQTASQTLDFSMLPEIEIWYLTMNKAFLMPLMMPSLKSLNLFSYSTYLNKDIFEFLLMNAPNLKVLKCTWPSIGKALESATLICRSTKLSILYFYNVQVYPSPLDVANFILSQMEPNGKIKFEGPHHDYTSKALISYENEILKIVKSKNSKYNNFTFPKCAYGNYQKPHKLRFAKFV